MKTWGEGGGGGGGKVDLLCVRNDTARLPNWLVVPRLT